MKLEGFFIGITILTMVFALGLGIIGESMSNYSINDFNNGSFSNVINKSVDLYKTQNELKSNIMTRKTSELSAWDAMIQGGYLAIQSIINSFGVTGDILSALAMELHFVNPIIIGTTIAIIAVLIILAVVYIIMRVGNKAG